MVSDSVPTSSSEPNASSGSSTAERAFSWRCQTISFLERFIRTVEPEFIATEAVAPRYSDGEGGVKRAEGSAGPVLRPGVVDGGDGLVGSTWQALMYSVDVVWSPSDPMSAVFAKLAQSIESGKFGSFDLDSGDLDHPLDISVSGSLPDADLSISALSDSDTPGSLILVTVGLAFEISDADLQSLKATGDISSSYSADDLSVSEVAKSC